MSGNSSYDDIQNNSRQNLQKYQRLYILEKIKERLNYESNTEDDCPPSRHVLSTLTYVLNHKDEFLRTDTLIAYLVSSYKRAVRWTIRRPYIFEIIENSGKDVTVVGV